MTAASFRRLAILSLLLPLLPPFPRRDDDFELPFEDDPLELPLLLEVVMVSAHSVGDSDTTVGTKDGYVDNHNTANL